MQPDVIFVVGVALAGLSLVSILSAMSDGRTPRVSAVGVIVSAGLIVYAARAQPGGYSLAEIPDVFVRVIAMVIN